MNSLQDKIIDDFLSVRNFNKTLYLNGLIDEKQLDKAQKETMSKYAYMLSGHDENELVYSIIQLEQAEAEENKITSEYAFLGRGEN
jgi:hypothetical protein